MKNIRFGACFGSPYTKNWNNTETSMSPVQDEMQTSEVLLSVCFKILLSQNAYHLIKIYNQKRILDLIWELKGNGKEWLMRRSDFSYFSQLFLSLTRRLRGQCNFHCRRGI